MEPRLSDQFPCLSDMQAAEIKFAVEPGQGGGRRMEKYGSDQIPLFRLA